MLLDDERQPTSPPGVVGVIARSRSKRNATSHYANKLNFSGRGGGAGLHILNILDPNLGYKIADLS